MLYETVDSWPLKGLMCGKMGICLFLYHYGVLTESQLFWNKSYEVLCNILRDSKVNRELDYNHGALGIASAIEYLRNHQFIELNTDKLLTKIDSFVITSIQKMIDNGFKKTSMSLYHFDIYISQRKKNKPEFEKLPLFEKEMRQFTTTQYFNNRNKVSEWFKHPQNIKSPGIIGWAGYGWKLINQIYPDYPIDNSLFYEYISF